MGKYYEILIGFLVGVISTMILIASCQFVAEQKCMARTNAVACVTAAAPISMTEAEDDQL